MDVVRKSVPVHVCLLQAYGLCVAESSEHFYSDFSILGTVLGLGIQRWETTSP